MNQRLEEAQQVRNPTENPRKTAVKEACAALRAMIDQLANDLGQEIDSIEQINRSTTDAYHAQLAKVKRILEDRGAELTKTLANRNHLRILQDQKQLASNLDDVAEILEKVTQAIKVEYQVEGIDQLRAAFVKCLPSARINRSDGERRKIICEI